MLLILVYPLHPVQSPPVLSPVQSTLAVLPGHSSSLSSPLAVPISITDFSPNLTYPTHTLPIPWPTTLPYRAYLTIPYPARPTHQTRCTPPQQTRYSPPTTDHPPPASSSYPPCHHHHTPSQQTRLPLLVSIRTPAFQSIFYSTPALHCTGCCCCYCYCDCSLCFALLLS